MPKIDWYGNDGYCFPDSGAIKTAKCGICGTKMNVRRNVLGATSFAEAMAGREHRHDRFFCPRAGENWHKKICRLKAEVYIAEINNSADYEKKKKLAEKKILKLLKAHAAR